MTHVNRLIPLLVAAALGAACHQIASRRTLRRLRRQVAVTAHRADHDRLTGLLNRGGIEDAYRAESGIDRRLMIIDVDAFKAINDQYGHPTGDLVLAALGTRIRDLLHTTGGIAGRLGGDEFAILIPQHLDITVIVAALAAPLTVSGSRPATVRVSVGIAAVPATTPITRALSQADIALYHAKRRGRPVIYRAGMTYPRLPSLRRHARDHRSRMGNARHGLRFRRTVPRGYRIATRTSSPAPA
ncbi:diguanylate cyclase (GGDEF)-like protein [Catenuloplanes nepalensis]|uniref:Diguanylate cyclase (GGDEF)-like protein n=1 Tax=Catenuloplanes nepalensis TaxID=587533 RepID=A0ABT9MME9_9ACTN|nr:GGDEF domain-containing protein [Catenuloplanes nepalensis]MDP9792607.1 diguanylate cyclase (GGDEF)-like protein [Catenuloplanes nepalensis]